MKYYQEITLLSGEDVSANFLMSKIFQKVHLAIVEGRKNNSSANYAVSFPQYTDTCIGEKLRIFSNSQENMENLHLADRFSKLSDYVHWTGVRVVPVKIIKGTVVFCRYRNNGNPEALARRYAKRHDCSYEEALLRYKYDDSSSNLPYIIVESSSTGKKFSLFIRKKEVTNSEKIEFDYYGLGDGEGVPDF